MMGLSLGHLLILGLIVLLFGARRLPELGASLGAGILAFKKGLEGNPTKPPETQVESVKVVENKTNPPSA